MEKNIQLTKREKEVLELFKEGLNNLEIAERLDISQRFVLIYLGYIFHKLDANSIKEAIIIADELGLLD